MILLHLLKREPANKMFVVKWEFITKEIASTIKQAPGRLVVVEESVLSKDFFKSHKRYFFEDGRVRYSPI